MRAEIGYAMCWKCVKLLALSPVVMKMSSIFVRSRVKKISVNDEKWKQNLSVMISIHLLKSRVWEALKYESFRYKCASKSMGWRVSTSSENFSLWMLLNLQDLSFIMRKENWGECERVFPAFHHYSLTENHRTRELYSLAFSYHCKHIQLVMKIAMNFPESGLFSSSFRTNQKHKYFMLATVIDCFKYLFLACEWNIKSYVKNISSWINIKYFFNINT